jgi:hypothetical protein
MAAKPATAGILLAAALLVAPLAHAQHTILRTEPAMGTMKQGQIVYVDDGKCAKGQVRRVSGGDHIDVGGTKRIRRTSSCVARPQ